MSRSCQSAIPSVTGGQRTHDPGQSADPFGTDGVLDVGIADEPFCPAANGWASRRTWSAGECRTSSVIASQAVASSVRR